MPRAPRSPSAVAVAIPRPALPRALEAWAAWVALALALATAVAVR